MDTSNARSVLAAIVQEQKNWEAARLRIGEVLETYDKANEELASLDARRNDLKQSIVNLERDLTRGREAVDAEIKNRKAAMEQELQEKQSEIDKLEDARKKANQEYEVANRSAKEAGDYLQRARAELERVKTHVEEAKALREQLTKVGG